jgi:hypothetical protein
MNKTEEIPTHIADFLQSAFEQAQFELWKYKIINHLKVDPGALPEIQKIAQKNIEKSEGIVKEFNQWILNGCKP